MNDRGPNPSSLNQVLSVAAVIGSFLVFGFLLCLIYLPNRPQAFPVGSVPPAERAQRLSDLRAEEVRLANGYSWIDREKGIVRLPIEQAMDLTLQEFSDRSSDSAPEK